MKKPLLLLSIIITTIGLYAQNELTQTIRGVIIDKQSQTVLPGASIILSGSNPTIGTTADIYGNFKLERVPIGRQSINISFIGYNSITKSNINVTSGKEIVLTIELEEQAFVTQEVIIHAKERKDIATNKMATVSARSFTIEETERYAGSLGDPSRMVANYAGVVMTNDTRNDIIIRGNSPSGLLWRLDGIEIPNPNHFGASGTTGGPISMLNNNVLTNSDFFTSAFPADYGNAISGVFDLKMRSGNNQKHEYVGQIGFNGFEFGAEGPFVNGKQASYLVNYRYSTLKVFNAFGINMGLGAAIPQYQDLTFKINLPGTKFGKFSLIGIGGKSYIELYDSKLAANYDDENTSYNLGGCDLDFGSDMGVLGLSHLYFINENTRIQTNLSVLGSRISTNIDSLKFNSQGAILQNSNYKFYESNENEIKYSASTHLKTKFNARNSASVGLYYDLYNVKYIDSLKANNSFENNMDVTGNIYLIRGYGQWQYRYTKNITLNSGLYSQYVGINNEISVEPRIGLKINLSGNQSVSMGYGLHSQMQPRYLYFIQTNHIHDNLTISQPNKDLLLTKSNQFVVAYDKLFSEDFRFKTELYYQNLYNVPVSVVSPQFSILNGGDSFGGIIVDSLVNNGTGTNYGVEFTLEKFFSNNYFFLGTLSLFESKYKGYDEIERNTAYNGNYVVNILGGYEFKIGKNNIIAISVRAVYAGGKRYIPIDINESINNNATRYNWENAYNDKHDDYFRTDLRISYKINSKKFSQEWAIDLQNLTNNKNIYSQSYNPRTKNISYDYQSGFLPMFLYRINF